MPYIELLTPIGLMKIHVKDDAIVSAFFSGLPLISYSEKVKRKKIFIKNATKTEKTTLQNAETALIRYFAGELDALLEVKVKPIGTDFQLKVWRKLLNIPSGKIVSYRKIAERIGNPKSARAVGQACGKNPIILFVPCHRVTRENDHLGGYSAGIKRKIFLLQHERTLIAF